MGTMGHPESTIWFLDVPWFYIEININKPSRSIQLLGYPHDKIRWKSSVHLCKSSSAVWPFRSSKRRSCRTCRLETVSLWRIHDGCPGPIWAVSASKHTFKQRVQVTVVQVPWSKLPNLQPQNNKQRKSEHPLNVSHRSNNQCQPCIKSDTWH